MTTLEQVLAQEAFVGLNAQQTLDTLNADGAPIVNHTLYTFKKVVEVLGQEEARIVIGGIKAIAAQDPLVDVFYNVMCSIGQDFSNSEWQDKITAFAEYLTWSAETSSKMREIGVMPQKIWQNYELAELPTIEQIEAILAGPNERQRIAHFINEVLNPALANPDLTVADVQALAANADNWVI